VYSATKKSNLNKTGGIPTNSLEVEVKNVVSGSIEQWKISESFVREIVLQHSQWEQKKLTEQIGRQKNNIKYWKSDIAQITHPN